MRPSPQRESLPQSPSRLTEAGPIGHGSHPGAQPEGPAAALPGGSEPFIDVDDIAEIAAEALMSEAHAGQVYDVTGPRLLTFTDVVTEIAAATGRDLHFVQVPVEDYRQGLAAAEVPADFAAFLTDLITTVLDGRNASVTDGVERALGRAPHDFKDYVRRIARTGVWDAA